MTFYLGTDRVHWLASAGVPLFVSHRQLTSRVSLPRATSPWALDSGGFTELSTHGEWKTTPEQYVSAIRRYRDEIGMLQWAAPQDWMNEPAMIERTGLSVPEHQRRTVENYLHLRDIAADLPIIPVLQGWDPDDYLRCADLYAAAGVDLAAEPVVGVGTVCRRQDTASGTAVLTELRTLGLSLHGFGVKVTGLRAFGALLTSSDSMAWSYRARRAAGDRQARGKSGSVDGCPKKTCAHCLHFALTWREALLRHEQGEPAWTLW